MEKFNNETVLLRKRTAFNQLTVTQTGDTVTLWSGASRQTKIEEGVIIQPCLEYSQNAFLSLAFCREPRDVLILGLGGGAIPSLFHALLEDACIDVVEVDPEIPSIASRYFMLPESSRLRVFIKDALIFLLETQKQYDIIIMDTYYGNRLPDTVDNTIFTQEVARVLKSGGVFVSNLMTGQQTDYKGRLKRIKGIFRQVRQLPGERSKNTLVFAGDRKIPKRDLLENAMALAIKFPFHLDMLTLLKRLKK